MKVVLAGGAGQLGRILTRRLTTEGHDVVILSRQTSGDCRVRAWDGRTLGPWAAEIEGAGAVINLAGRSVNCRYSRANLKEILDSRVDSTRIVGRAITQAKHPPRVWLQMGTATIYAHTFDAPNDETHGRIGGAEPNAPARWRSSIDIARGWEQALEDVQTPTTRKVALRTGIVMSPQSGGTFAILLGLTRWGLGGTIAGGRQFVSWIHDEDFARAVQFLLDRDDIAGPVNLTGPCPLPQKQFMAELRRAWGARIGLPATAEMMEVAAFFHRTESELILKSRRVVPQRLLDAGFSFTFPQWYSASDNLVSRWRLGIKAG